MKIDANFDVVFAFFFAPILFHGRFLGMYSFKSRTVRGFIVDEAFMADEELMFNVINICFQLPLLETLRRPGALPLFGYRDVLLFGDIRQLPPASGRQPFWATETFQSFF